MSGLDFNFSATIPSQYDATSLSIPSNESSVNTMPPMLPMPPMHPMLGIFPENVKEFKPMDIEVEARFENYEAIFVFNEGGYTFVNILKEYLDKLPEIKFVGKRKHHKLDNFIHLRIVLDREWVDQNHSTTEQAMLDCLRRSGRKAANDCLDLRNTIPDVESRSVTFDKNRQPQMSSDIGPSPFKMLFDPSDLTF